MLEHGVMAFADYVFAATPEERESLKIGMAHEQVMNKDEIQTMGFERTRALRSCEHRWSRAIAKRSCAARELIR